MSACACGCGGSPLGSASRFMRGHHGRACGDHAKLTRVDRNRRIREEAATGRTYQEIADEFGISRQRVDQIIKPDVARARGQAFDAVAAGKLRRPDVCPLCGATGEIHAHHADYSRPLDVEWMCEPCHHAAHRGQERRRPAKWSPVPVACKACGRVRRLNPSEAALRMYCSQECARGAPRLTPAEVSARYEAMAVRLREYAADHGYVPIVTEFARHITGHHATGQSIPRLASKVDPRRRGQSYRDILDRIYRTAGFDRPDGRRVHVRLVRSSRAASALAERDAA